MVATHPEAVRPIKSPRCPTCGRQMRLECSESDKHYVNLEQTTFVCDCGARSTNLIRKD
jgi:C4-type Zn-finger protein